jgi:hypothetical protein
MTNATCPLAPASSLGKGVAIAAIAGMAILASLETSQAQNLPVQISKYWCDKLGGSYSGNTCMAPYRPHPGACEVFRSLNVNDPKMIAELNEVMAARVCLAKRTEEAKINSLKLRANLMGYVTAGNPKLEDMNDPIKNSSYRPEPGKPSYWTGVTYFLYQCFVEICTSK